MDVLRIWPETESKVDERLPLGLRSLSGDSMGDLGHRGNGKAVRSGAPLAIVGFDLGWPQRLNSQAKEVLAQDRALIFALCVLIWGA